MVGSSRSSGIRTVLLFFLDYLYVLCIRERLHSEHGITSIPHCATKQVYVNLAKGIPDRRGVDDIGALEDDVRLPRPRPRVACAGFTTCVLTIVSTQHIRKRNKGTKSSSML